MPFIRMPTYRFNRLGSFADKQQKLEVHMMLSVIFPKSVVYDKNEVLFTSWVH